MNWPTGTMPYLLIGHVLIPIVINGVVNALIGSLTWSDVQAVPIRAVRNGAVGDFVGTCFLLPFITCLIATPIVRWQVRHSTAPRIPDGEIPRWTRLLSGVLLVRSVQCGLMGLLVVSGPVCLAWSQFAGESISADRLIVIKTVFAALLGIPVTPLIAIVALCDRDGSGSEAC